MKSLIALIAVICMAVPAAGQTSVQGRASIQIGEVMSLQVRPGGGMAVLSPDGSYRHLESAVALTVMTNRPWELHAVTTGPDTRLASNGGVGAPEPALWWRSGDGTETGAYQRAERLPVRVAAGTGGVTEIEIDYRWLDGPGRELEPGTTLQFMLSAR